MKKPSLILCPTCGYDLRASMVTENVYHCPECGAVTNLPRVLQARRRKRRTEQAALIAVFGVLVLAGAGIIHTTVGNSWRLVGILMHAVLAMVLSTGRQPFLGMQSPLLRGVFYVGTAGMMLALTAMPTVPPMFVAIMASWFLGWGCAARLMSE